MVWIQIRTCSVGPDLGSQLAKVIIRLKKSPLARKQSGTQNIFLIGKCEYFINMPYSLNQSQCITI